MASAKGFMPKKCFTHFADFTTLGIYSLKDMTSKVPKPLHFRVLIPKALPTEFNSIILIIWHKMSVWRPSNIERNVSSKLNLTPLSKIGKVFIFNMQWFNHLD